MHAKFTWNKSNIQINNILENLKFNEKNDRVKNTVPSQMLPVAPRTDCNQQNTKRTLLYEDGTISHDEYVYEDKKLIHFHKGC